MIQIHVSIDGILFDSIIVCRNRIRSNVNMEQFLAEFCGGVRTVRLESCFFCGVKCEDFRGHFGIVHEDQDLRFVKGAINRQISDR